jgi:hypothetical protein
VSDQAAGRHRASGRHLRFGWWALALFATLGLTLEVLHGFKVGAYLDVSNEPRRLMWRLAHAHGALIAIINILYGLTLGSGALGSRDLASRALVAAGVLLPLGFFLGGLVYYGGDPGLGIVLVPIGAILLLAALVSIARDAGRSPSPEPDRGGKRGQS